MAAGGSSYCPSYLILLLLMVTHPLVTAAPYLKTATGGSHIQQQQQPPLDHLFKPEQGLIGPLYRHNDYSMNPPTSGSCLYQLRHYEEGDRIITNEPCLNCTCHNSMLMCYLKVCPFSKPIGQDCKVEKNPDQCCPVITCPQVKVNLQVMQMTSTTTLSPTAASDPQSGLVPYSPHGCTIDDLYYSDGVQVPGNPREPCELCYCIRNHTTCVMQECVLKIPGCQPVFEDGICCPVRYSCDYDDYPEQAITTTTLAPNGTLLTTTLQPPEHAVGCMHNGDFYADGAEIPSQDPCEHCYCMKADIICAIQECVSPLAEKDENCKPRPPLPGQCCPESYDCLDAPISSSTQRDQEPLKDEQETILEIADVATDSILEATTFSKVYDTQTQDTTRVETRTTQPEPSEAPTPIIEDIPYKISTEKTLVEDKETQPDVKLPQTDSPDIFVDTTTIKLEADIDLQRDKTTKTTLEGSTFVTKISSSPPFVTDSTLIDHIKDTTFLGAPLNDTDKTHLDVDVDMPTDRTTASPYEIALHDTDVPLEYPQITTSKEDGYLDTIDRETTPAISDDQLAIKKITTTKPDIVSGISNDTYTKQPEVTSDETSTDKPYSIFDLTTDSTVLSEQTTHFTKGSIESGVFTSIDYIPEDATTTVSADVLSSFKPEILDAFTSTYEDDLYTQTRENVSISTTIRPSTDIDFSASKTTPLGPEILSQITSGPSISPIADTTVDDDSQYLKYPVNVSVDTRATPETEVTTSKATITTAYEVNVTEESLPDDTTSTPDIYHTGAPALASIDNRTVQTGSDIDLSPMITTESPDDKHIYITEAPESVSTLHDTSIGQIEVDSDTATLKTTEKTISKVSNITTLSPHFPETSSIDDEYYTESPETVSVGMTTVKTKTDIEVSTLVNDSIPDHKVISVSRMPTETPSRVSPSFGDTIDTESPEIATFDFKTTPFSFDSTPTTLSSITSKEVLPDIGKVKTELPEAINITVEEFPYTDSPKQVTIEIKAPTTSDDFSQEKKVAFEETTAIRKDIDLKSTTSIPLFSEVEVEKHSTTESQKIDIFKDSRVNTTDEGVDTRYTQATELPEFDITKLETEIPETTEATIQPAIDTTPREMVTSELPIIDGIKSHYTTVTLKSEIEKTTSSIEETAFVTKLPYFDTEEAIDDKHEISTTSTDIPKPMTTKSPGDVSVEPEVEIDAITIEPSIDIFEKGTTPQITSFEPAIDEGTSHYIRDEMTTKAATVTSIPIKDESRLEIGFTTDVSDDIDTTTKTLPPSRKTTEDFSFGLESIFDPEDDSVDPQVLPNLTQIAPISTTDVTLADGLYTKSPLPSHTQTIQPDIYVDITTSQATTGSTPVRLHEGTKLSTESSTSEMNVTLASVSEEPEEYVTTSITERIPSEVTKSDYITETILKDDGKEIMKTITTISSIREGDETVTELPIISGYPEYEPPYKPEIFDHLSPEIKNDSIYLDLTTESEEFVTKSSSVFEKISTTHKEPIHQTETTSSVQSISDFEQTLTTPRAPPLSHDYISESTAQDITFEVTSTMPVKTHEKDDDRKTTTIEKGSPILTILDDQTTLGTTEVLSAEITTPYEASTVPQETPKVPSRHEISTTDTSIVTGDIDIIDSTTITSKLDDQLLRETTETPIEIQKFTDKLPSEFTISDDAFDSIVTTQETELSSISSPTIGLIDAITTGKSEFDSPEQNISVTEATIVGPSVEFTPQAGLEETSTKQEEERPDIVTTLKEYITTASSISPNLMKCDQVTCQPPPPTFLRCRERKTAEECCPFYDCPVIFPDDEFERTTSVPVKILPELNISLSDQTEQTINFTTIKPTTLDIISEEEIREKIPQDEKRPGLKPEIMDQTMIKPKDEEMLLTTYYEPTIDLVTTSSIDETMTKSPVIEDSLEDDKKTDIDLKPVIASVNVSDHKYQLEGVTIPVKEVTVETTSKVFDDTEKDITTSTLMMDIEAVSVSTPAVQIFKDTPYQTTAFETVSDVHHTTISFLDKPVDKVELIPIIDSSVNDSISESDLDNIATTKRIHYEDSSPPSIKVELDQTTVYSDFSDSTYVTKTSVDEKVIRNLTVGDFLMDDVELSTQKTSTSVSNKTLPSLSEVDISVTTKISDMIEETSVKIPSITLSPVVKDEEIVTTEVIDTLPIITEQPTDEDVTQKLIVDETTSEELMVITEEPEIKGIAIHSTDQSLDGVTTDRDGITAMKTKVTTIGEATTPSILSFTTDYTTLSSSLSEDELTTYKIKTDLVESSPAPEFSEMDVTTSSTLVDDDHFMETKPFEDEKEITDVMKEVETTGAPGEGLCTFNGKIYSNGESVPVSSQCQQECKCSHSVISCKAIKCSPPPPTFLRCEVKQTSNECCPFYECPIHFPPEVKLEPTSETTKTTEDREEPGKTTEKPHADDPKMPLGTPAPEQANMTIFISDDAVTQSPTLKDKTYIYTESTTKYPLSDVEITTEKSESVDLLSTVVRNISIQPTTDSILGIYTTSPEGIDIEDSTKLKLDLEEDVTTVQPIKTTALLLEPSKQAMFMDCVSESYFFKHGELTAYKDKCRDNCKCNDGKFECEQRACSAPPPVSLGISCTSSRTNNSCCPIYECQAISGDICFHEGKAYEDGQGVFSSEKCTSCYCIRGEVKCTSQQCKAPHEHCKSLAHSNDECCPSLYTCTETSFPPTKPSIEDVDVMNITTITAIEKTTKPATSEVPITFEATTPKVSHLTEEMITEILSNLTTPTPPLDEFGSKVTPEETVPEDIAQKVDDHFPEFPDITDQSYLAPHLQKTTTKAPTTSTAEIMLSPGSCLFDGKPYVSAQQIPRDNPCDFCFCFRGDIICLQQSCPPPIPGCYEEAIPGFCCPRYECPVQKTVMNVTTTTPSPFPGFPAISKTSRVNMCEIEGQYYASGAKVTAASNPCLDCMCGDDGSLKCSPRECPANRKIYRKSSSR